MTTETSLRDVRENDRDFLCKVYASTRMEEMELSGWPQEQIDAFLAQQFQYQDTKKKKEFPDSQYSIIVYQGKDIGRLYLDRREEEHRIIDIALLPEYRGKGLGGRIMREILEEANRKGKSVGIHVERENPAMHLYKRLGFVKTGEQGLYYLMVWNAKSGTKK